MSSGKQNFHSLFFESVGGDAGHLPSVCLGFAAVPQVNEGLADTQQNHGDSGTQTAAVTSHLQQVALHLHLTPHAVKTPVICEQETVTAVRPNGLNIDYMIEYKRKNRAFNIRKMKMSDIIKQA